MRIHALMSWYEESPAWLAAAVSGIARFADGIIAVDGPYALFENATRHPRSGIEQADAISACARGAGIDCTIHSRSRPWASEVEKRSFMFKLATAVAEEGDWLYILDADEHVLASPADLRATLEASKCEAATVDLVTRMSATPLPGEDAQKTTYFQKLPAESIDRHARRFFRFDPTLRVVGAHYIYAAGPEDDPRYLWGSSATTKTLPAAHIDGFRVDHLHDHRQPDRLRRGEAYYKTRDALGVELIP